RLRGMGFRYSLDGPKVLCGVDLLIPQGSRVGFIGATGSGKSTLLDVIMGLLPATDGAVLIDDNALQANNQRAWQRRLAHVPQAIYMADSSIEENIAFGISKDLIDVERVKHAAAQAQIADYIE